MAGRRCFVQFPHPGQEHSPVSGRNWLKTSSPHMRKFMQFRGDWIERDGTTRRDDCLRAWGEWEAESELIRKFTVGREPHHPHNLWKPYWEPKHSYRCLRNTDPFIFGDCFLYSNCGQPVVSKRGLKHLGKGSVITFGSKVEREAKWALDTVFVVRDSLLYDPLDARRALAGKVPLAFLAVTGGPLTDDPKLRELADKGNRQEFRLYRGATPKDRVCGMYSFFPAIQASSNCSFARPIVGLPEQFFTYNCQAPKGIGQHLPERTLNELRLLWDLLVAQVRCAGLVLGTRAEIPPRRDS